MLCTTSNNFIVKLSSNTRDNLQRHTDTNHADVEKPDLKQQALIDNELYFKKMENGKHIFDMIENGEIEQESLSRDNAHAFGVYNKMRPIIDVKSMELRAWQDQVLQLVEEPTSRHIIWIIGRRGNEGKSWL